MYGVEQITTGTTGAARLGERLVAYMERQHQERQVARAALLDLFHDPEATEDQRTHAIDSVAETTGLTGETVHLALCSLFTTDHLEMRPDFSIVARENA